MSDTQTTAWLRPRNLIFAFVMIVSGIAATVTLWAWLRPKPQPDMEAILRQNNKGVGLLEQFAAREAIPVFEKIVKQAPDWTPGKINLGIALLNTNNKKNLTRALDIFGDILKKEPDNIRAHYCTGIILTHQGQLDDARHHFKKVTELDANDGHAWWFLGGTYSVQTAEARKCFEKAVEADPYLQGGLYALMQSLRFHDEKKALAVYHRWEALDKAKKLNPSKIAFSEMGRYAEPIGHDPQFVSLPDAPLPLFKKDDTFRVQLAPGATWATAGDFGQDDVGQLRRQVRRRFGGVVVVLDYDNDTRMDLFLPGAVTEGGKVRDLLLHNEGERVFRDVTKEAGLADARPSLGCAVGDYNNDGFVDLLITCVGEQFLFRNVANKKISRRFEKIDKAIPNTAVCLTAHWLDVDQDGDQDLLLCQMAVSAAQAQMVLTAKKTADSELHVFLNVGEAPPGPDGSVHTLSTKFRAWQKATARLGKASGLINLAVSDLDHDHDPDVITLSDGSTPKLIFNDRLLQFHHRTLPKKLAPSSQYNGAVVFNFDGDRRSDLLLLRSEQKPVFLINSPDGRENNWENRFQVGVTDAPPLRHAHTTDLDLDGHYDIVGLSQKNHPVLLRNDGKRLQTVTNAFGLANEFPKDLVAVTTFPAADGMLDDLLLWSEKQGLSLKRNLGNGNHGIRIRPRGKVRLKTKPTRCTSDGTGVWLMAQSAGHWTGLEYATLSGSLAHAYAPVTFGLGKYDRADVVRLRWPDNVWQAELSLPGSQTHVISQLNRYTDSCPLLFSWDGERYVFITDMLGAGAMGEAGPVGAGAMGEAGSVSNYRIPRPEESVKIEANQLKAKNDKYHVKIVEARDEVAYLDQMELVVVDVPAERHVYPEERFVSSLKGPSQDLLVYDKAKRIFPKQARDHKGRDVTAKLMRWDRNMVDGFAKRAWLGYAEDHWLEIDFGDQLADIGAKTPLSLCLVGWTAYPYPESIWAATQAGIPLNVPALQRRTADRTWETILPELGFPAGFPRMMSVDVTGKLSGKSCVLRIPTNMQVFWDQLFVVPLRQRLAAGRDVASKGINVRTLPVRRGELAYRGFVQEFLPDGQDPPLYDYYRLARVAVPKIQGRLTKYGDVTPLFQQRDDQFAIMGPGDEATLVFDGRSLPKLPAGWTRSFVLRAYGYSRSCGPFIAEGGTVFPLPFRGMSNFPYGKDEHYPRLAAHREYLRRYLTREVGTLRP